MLSLFATCLNNIFPAVKQSIRIILRRGHTCDRCIFTNFYIWRNDGFLSDGYQTKRVNTLFEVSSVSPRRSPEPAPSPITVSSAMIALSITNILSDGHAFHKNGITHDTSFSNGNICTDDTSVYFAIHFCTFTDDTLVYFCVSSDILWMPTHHSLV